MKYLKSVLTTVRRESPILYTIVLINLALTIGCIFGILFDDRTLVGINIWIKPLKFAISTGIYTLSVGYLVTLYPYSRLKKNILNNIVSWSLLLEMVIIVSQAYRGVQSHYNMNTPYDGILFGAMGILISINVLIMVLFAIDTIRLKMRVPRSVQTAILLGWLVVLFGSWVGGQMIGQMAHNVGVVDGGDGLPLLNWSTVAGDLRVAHFFGLHGLQIIPLFAFGLFKKWSAPNKNHSLVVIIFGLVYAGWIGYTFYQAKQAMPFLTL
ncbi:hypothetical protein [Poritiphilus flavus]|uniref:Uncharacterized protein n=1 Tax=Poritiphilus flavus TaxID=2697053 RepID=A0A6L9EEU9_9FLAO|nr:hypothetical protein [Poritiphilus flavus]NAS13290.1 hypothetical protein [Poritiphilus flavus]